MNITATAERAHLFPSYVDGPRQDARNLRGEMIDALLAGNLNERMPVPGWRDAQSARQSDATAQEIVWDNLSGDDEAFHDLMQIVALAAAGKMTPELHLRAQAFIARQAKQYADFHAEAA